MSAWVSFCLGVGLLGAGSAESSPADLVQPNQAHHVAEEIGKGLRCPVCQGMSIAESPSQMAQDMMKVVPHKVAEGESAQQIDDYFVSRYGEWVLLDPPSRGITLWVWVLPPVLLAGFVAWALRYVRRLRPTTAQQGASEPSADAKPSAALQAIRDAVRR